MSISLETEGTAEATSLKREAPGTFAVDGSRGGKEPTSRGKKSVAMAIISSLLFPCRVSLFYVAGCLSSLQFRVEGTCVNAITSAVQWHIEAHLQSETRKERVRDS